MGRTPTDERIKGNKIRNKILDRDKHQCRLCGSNKDLEVHHMKTLKNGGKSASTNLITLCANCHNFAPEDSVKANKKYLEQRNKFVYEEMIKNPDINVMVAVAYTEFLAARVDEYVKLGFINEKQKDLILNFELDKIY